MAAWSIPQVFFREWFWAVIWLPLLVIIFAIRYYPWSCASTPPASSILPSAQESYPPRVGHLHHLYLVRHGCVCDPYLGPRSLSRSARGWIHEANGPSIRLVVFLRRYDDSFNVGRCSGRHVIRVSIKHHDSQKNHPSRLFPSTSRIRCAELSGCLLRAWLADHPARCAYLRTQLGCQWPRDIDGSAFGSGHVADHV